MKKQNSQALLSYRMERSHEFLRAAEIMLENDMLTFSMNRIYYAMFYTQQRQNLMPWRQNGTNTD